MHGRVVFPIHNIEGQLIAYVGRWAEDPVPSGKRKYFLPPTASARPRTLQPASRDQGGTEAIVVEGYFDVLRLYAAGYQCVVSIMGASITDEQVDLLKGYDRVLLLWMGMSREGSQQYQSQRNSSMIFLCSCYVAGRH